MQAANPVILVVSVEVVASYLPEADSPISAVSGAEYSTLNGNLCPTMELTALKTVIHQFYADVWNRHDTSAIPVLLHPHFTFRGSLGQSKTGHAEFADYVDFVHQALDAYRCDILDLVAERNQCFARMRFSGIHRGDFFSYKPTGKKVEWAGAALFTFEDELVTDLWVLGDVHGLLQQLERNSG